MRDDVERQDMYAIDGHGVLMNVPDIPSGNTMTIAQRIELRNSSVPYGCQLQCHLTLDGPVAYTSEVFVYDGSSMLNFVFEGPIRAGRYGVSYVGLMLEGWTKANWTPGPFWPSNRVIRYEVEE